MRHQHQTDRWDLLMADAAASLTWFMSYVFEKVEKSKGVIKSGAITGYHIN